MSSEKKIKKYSKGVFVYSLTGYSWFKGTSTLKLGLDFVHLN